MIETVPRKAVFVGEQESEIIDVLNELITESNSQALKQEKMVEAIRMLADRHEDGSWGDTRKIIEEILK